MKSLIEVRLRSVERRQGSISINTIRMLIAIQFIIISTLFVFSLCAANASNWQRGTCTMVWIFVGLKVTELRGGRVSTRLLKASGGVASLVVLLDTVATWMSKDSSEDEAHVLSAIATTVASISIIVYSIAVGSRTEHRGPRGSQEDLRNPSLRRSEAVATYNATSAI